jgi:hypothetical protein
MFQQTTGYSCDKVTVLWEMRNHVFLYCSSITCLVLQLISRSSPPKSGTQFYLLAICPVHHELLNILVVTEEVLHRLWRYLFFDFKLPSSLFWDPDSMSPVYWNWQLYNLVGRLVTQKMTGNSMLAQKTVKSFLEQYICVCW